MIRDPRMRAAFALLRRKAPRWERLLRRIPMTRSPAHRLREYRGVAPFVLLGDLSTGRLVWGFTGATTWKSMGNENLTQKIAEQLNLAAITFVQRRRTFHGDGGPPLTRLTRSFASLISAQMRVNNSDHVVGYWDFVDMLTMHGVPCWPGLEWTPLEVFRLLERRDFARRYNCKNPIMITTEDTDPSEIIDWLTETYGERTLWMRSASPSYIAEWGFLDPKIATHFRMRWS